MNPFELDLIERQLITHVKSGKSEPFPDFGEVGRDR